jgi:hypothetical protein
MSKITVVARVVAENDSVASAKTELLKLIEPSISCAFRSDRRLARHVYRVAGE